MYRAADPHVTNCWNRETGQGECDCPDCEPPCPVEHHVEELDRLIHTLVAAQNGIINLRAFVIARPSMVSPRIAPRIFKQLLLRASVRLYDCGFWSYSGPTCTCHNLKEAKLMLTRLHYVCIIAGVDLEPLWSFALHTPPPPM